MNSSLLKKKDKILETIKPDSCLSMAMRPALFAKTPESVENINSTLGLSSADNLSFEYLYRKR